MAVVKMGQIKSTPAKALAYISRPDATSDGVWVSTNADTVIDPSDFKAVARQFAHTTETVGVSKPRAGSVLAHHIIQSFDPKDGVDAAMAHRIGVQLAEQVTGGAHEYMIATHLDKGHVHNHIIVNAVNRETGRKLRVQRNTIGDIRTMSDALCRAEGLRVLPVPERASGRSFGDIYRVLRGDSGKQFIRTEIDKAAVTARSWVEFEATLARAGIETSTRGGRAGTVSFREISMARPVRDHRLGVGYTEQSIMARLTRQVVNHVGVDVSMVVKETRDTMTVVVPGTRRELYLTVAKSQVVRHGRALRLYVPANEDHLLSDRSGNLARAVTTEGLYEWFSRPALDASAAKQVGGQWNVRLTELQELQRRVNAKSRWMQERGATANDALSRAETFVADRHLTYQSALVATAELLTTPDSNSREIVALQAQLRILEREIDTARADIQSLTQLTTEETKMAVSHRIASDVDQRRHRRSESEQRVERDVYDEDAETTVQRENRADERSADAETAADATQESEDGARSLTLRERIEREAEKLRERTDGGRDSEGSRADDDGRTR